MNSKKLVSVALTATTILWAMGAATLPLAQAQTTADLQAQISALLAQISQLQAQLNGSSSTTSTSCYSFTRDLTVGSTGADVTALQQTLIAKGYLAIAAPTGYFGSLTQAAVGKWQAANGISPTAGYFGAKSRAFYASSCVSTGTGTGTGTGTTVPATGLSVSIDSQNPTSGALVTTASGFGSTSAARIPVLALDFTASNSGAVTVTALNVHKNGVLSDSSINGAYLIQNGQVLYQYNSLNQGVISFSGMNLQIPAGTTQTLWVAIDPSSGLSAGNTVSFSVNSASDVTAWDASNNAVTPSGAFPLNGGTFTATTVSNPPVAGLTVVTSSIATQVTAGTQNNIVGSFNFTGANSLVWLKGIKFTVIGSANMGDIRNVKLFVNGTQVGNTLATVASNGAAYFDLSSAPASLSTGNNNVQVYADVMGSPGKNFNFEVLNSYDINAIDSQYNVPIAITLTSGVDATIQIQQGQITVTQDSNTPTGQIAQGQSGVTLAKFDIYAAGEAVKVKFLGFKIAFTGVTTSTAVTGLANLVKNISLTDDAGGQVGTTINNPPSANTCDNTTGTGLGVSYTSSGAGQSTITVPGAVNYVDCFGTSGSPINYIIPANTTRVLSLKADVQSGALFTGVSASLQSESSNLQGLISSQTGSSSGASGSSLTLSTSLLQVTKNAAYGNQTIAPNTTGAHIGSYAFTASSASGAQINTVTIQVGTSTNGNTSGDIQNLKIMVNGVQFGTTQGVVADSATNASTYTFSGSPFTVPAGQTTYVDVYADVLSSAASSSPVTSLSGCSGTSITSFNALSCTGVVAGQALNVAAPGTTAMTVGLDSSAPAAAQLVMGSTQNTLAAFRFAETSNVQNVKITDLTVTQTSTSAKANFQNVTLYQGSTVIGTAGSASTTATGYAYVFHFAVPVIVPQANSVTLTLKGDVASFNSQGAQDNTTSTFGVGTSSITALGASSNGSVTVSGGATGNTMTVLRTVLTPSAATLGSTSGRVKSAVDNLATLTFTANTAGSAMLQTVALTFSGNAISATTTSAADFVLRDVNNSDVTQADNATTSGTCTSSPCTITWTFSTSTTPFIISGGTSYTFTLQTIDTGFATASGSNSVSLGATLQSTSAVTYYDNGSGTGATTSLPSTIVPLNISTVTFASGS